MAVFIKKTKAEILRHALAKLESQTPISATSPGSIARAFTEAITTELSDYYDALDFQIAQSVISSASGRALDLLGDLYNVKRRTVNDITAIDQKTGAFYFYIDAPVVSTITIPKGTQVYTATDSFVGRQLRYSTTDDTSIRIGQTRAFASIKPDFADAMYTAAPGTLVVHDFPSPVGVLVRSTNPKAIAPQAGLEDDNNYRLRIIKDIRVKSGGTIEAVRFSALSVPGVRDAKLREVPYGLGSFEIILTPEGTGFNLATSNEVRNKLNAVRPVGVRMFIKQPDLIAVDISATVVIKKSNSETQIDALGRRVDTAIKRYLNSLLAGEAMVYTKLVQYMLDVSNDILDVQFTRYAPNGIEVLRRNYTPQLDQMLIPGRIEVNVAAN